MTASNQTSASPVSPVLAAVLPASSMRITVMERTSSWPDDPEERWETFSDWLQLEHERWQQLAAELSQHDAAAGPALLKEQALPRLALIPLVEAMKHQPVLRSLYPFTTHHQLRLGTGAPDVTGGRVSSIWTEHVADGRFRVRRLLEGQPSKWTWSFEVVGEGTAAEMAQLAADEVTKEQLWNRS